MIGDWGHRACGRQESIRKQGLWVCTGGLRKALILWNIFRKSLFSGIPCLPRVEALGEEWDEVKWGKKR